MIRVVGLTGVGEERLIRLGGVNRDRHVLLRIRREPATVLVAVLVGLRLVHVPRATVAGGALGATCKVWQKQYRGDQCDAHGRLNVMPNGHDWGVGKTTRR
jgi:hypothetical protein